MKSLTRTALVLAAFLTPSLAFAQFGWGLTFTFGLGCGNTICLVGQNILYIINNILVPVLFALAFIVFLYGIALKYIFSGGDPGKVAEGHKLLLWGIIGFVVMISIWGIVNVVANSFGLGGAFAPAPPTSVPLY